MHRLLEVEKKNLVILIEYKTSEGVPARISNTSGTRKSLQIARNAPSSKTARNRKRDEINELELSSGCDSHIDNNDNKHVSEF